MPPNFKKIYLDTMGTLEIEPCHDSDGGVILNNKGAVNYFDENSTIISLEDYCISNSVLFEYSCVNNVGVGSNKRCTSSSICQSGECVDRKIPKIEK